MNWRLVAHGTIGFRVPAPQAYATASLAAGSIANLGACLADAGALCAAFNRGAARKLGDPDCALKAGHDFDWRCDGCGHIYVCEACGDEVATPGSAERFVIDREVRRLREALTAIAEHPHAADGYDDGEGNSAELCGHIDGHRCAAEIAKAALSPAPRDDDAKGGR